MAGKYPPLGSLKKLADENAANLKKAYPEEKPEVYLPAQEFETFKVFPTKEYSYDDIKKQVQASMGLPKDVLIIDPMKSPDPKLVNSATALLEKMKAIISSYDIPVVFKQHTKDPLKQSKLLIDTEMKPDKKIQEMLGVFPDKNPCGEVFLELPKPMPYVEMQIFTLGSDKPVPLAQNKEKDVGLSKLSQKNGKKKAPKVKKADPIFQWTFKSGQEVQGTRAMYSTLLRTDQTLTCNCPGWIFKKKGETTRFCKHTKQVEDEAKGVYKKWKSGGSLPSIELGDSAVSNLPTTKATAVPGIKYGRVIEVD